jgi:hypothetical protein
MNSSNQRPINSIRFLEQLSYCIPYQLEYGPSAPQLIQILEGPGSKAAGLPLPEQFVSGDDVANGKPAPDPYLLGAKKLGFDASDCIVFEDADAGVKAALAAGAAFVVGVSKRALETDADIVVEDLAGISFDGKQLVIPEHKIIRR